jgi:hypothetical protein
VVPPVDKRRLALKDNDASTTTSAVTTTMPLIHSGDRTHHQDQVIKPASLSAISVREKTAVTSWPRFQSRPGADCGFVTRTLKTTM